MGSNGVGLAIELMLAAAIALVGMALATIGAMWHLPRLEAPGATAITVGGVWLGMAAARSVPWSPPEGDGE